jgi:threonine/homoserine/homoserine lactone efflux protein
MTIQQITAFLLFAVVAAITPGPSNLILTSVGAGVGVLRGLPALAGASLGMGLMLFVLGFGLGSLVVASPFILTILKWLGIAFLLWLAWQIATAGHGEVIPTAKTRLGFWQLAAFQWVNPKAWLVCASAVSAFLGSGTGSPISRAFTLGLLFVIAAFPSCFVWLAFGASVQRLLRSERAARWFNVGMGVVLVGSVALLIW